MNVSVLPTTARSQIKHMNDRSETFPPSLEYKWNIINSLLFVGGGKGRFGYVWLILGKDFKISQKIVSQS